MSVSLTLSPPPFAFSGDKITAGFTCTSLNEQDGESSVNELSIKYPLSIGATLVIAYGQKTTTLVVSAGPDNDGTFILPSITNNTMFIAWVRSNYDLSTDFDFQEVAGRVRFISKEKTTGFDMLPFVNDTFNLQNINTGKRERPKANYKIAFRLFIENIANDGYDLIYDAPLSVRYGSAGKAEAFIGDKLNAVISNDIRNLLPERPGTDPLLCAVSCRRYYFEFAESYGDPSRNYRNQRSPVYTVIQGGLSFLGQKTKSLQELVAPALPETDRFLKQGTTQLITRYDSPQYLYFFNARADRNLKMFCQLYFSDGTSSLIIPYTLSAKALRKYAFNVSVQQIFIPENYPGKILSSFSVFLKNDALQPVSETITYTIDYQYKRFIRTFMNWSSWGTFDTRYFYGMGAMEFDQVQQVAERAVLAGESIMKGKSMVYDITLQTKFSLSTGFTTRKNLLFNKDFFASALKYRFVNGQYLPIQVTSKSIPEVNDEENGKYAQRFEYQYLFDDSAYTELDFDESAPDNVPPGAGGLPPGTINPGSGGIVKIINQNNEVIQSIAAPGEYKVIQFSGIIDDGNGNYTDSIIDNSI
jgi:hypothetical protein